MAPATSPLNAGDLFYCIQGGADRKCTYAQINSVGSAVQSSGAPGVGQLATWAGADLIGGVTALPALNFPALTGCVTTVAGALATSLAGTCALPNGWTATTQPANDNSSKVATTNYVDQYPKRYLLATLTASNSPYLESPTIFTGGSYSYYEILFDEIIPVTLSSGCIIQVYSGGVLKTTGYRTSYNVEYVSGTHQSINTAAINCSDALETLVGSLNGFWKVIRPYGTSSPKVWFGEFGEDSGARMGIGTVRGAWIAPDALDGFRVFFGAGNISSGVIKIYGVQ